MFNIYKMFSTREVFLECIYLTFFVQVSYVGSSLIIAANALDEGLQ